MTTNKYKQLPVWLQALLVVSFTTTAPRTRGQAGQSVTWVTLRHVGRKPTTKQDTDLKVPSA